MIITSLSAIANARNQRPDVAVTVEREQEQTLPSGLAATRILREDDLLEGEKEASPPP